MDGTVFDDRLANGRIATADPERYFDFSTMRTLHRRADVPFQDGGILDPDVRPCGRDRDRLVDTGCPWRPRVWRRHGPPRGVPGARRPRGATGRAGHTLGAAVRNRGTETAPPSTLRFYRSSNPTVSTGDAEVGAVRVPALPPAGVDVRSIDVAAPDVPGTSGTTSRQPSGDGSGAWAGWRSCRSRSRTVSPIRMAICRSCSRSGMERGAMVKGRGSLCWRAGCRRGTGGGTRGLGVRWRGAGCRRSGGGAPCRARSVSGRRDLLIYM